MPTYEYYVSNEVIKVLNHESEYTVYDLGMWREEIVNRYRCLLAHKWDLKRAKAYLDQMFFEIDTSLIDGALINSAIQLLFRCFANRRDNGRINLDPKKVFRKYAKDLGEEDYWIQYQQFANNRNKVIAHDQSDYKHGIVGITVNDLSGLAEDVVGFSISTGYLYKENQELLLHMIYIASRYVEDQLESVKKLLIEEYNVDKPDFNCILKTTISKFNVW